MSIDRIISATMDLRLLASRLADARTRDALARWLLAACAAGFVVTLGLLSALGHGVDRWVFVLIVWGALIYMPLRIALDALQPFAAGMRDALIERMATDPGRFERPDVLPLVVRDLFAREVTMPRITTPVHAQKAREAAIAILTEAANGADAQARLRIAIQATLTAASTEATVVSTGATGAAADTIQARWDGARALGALAALVTILAASYRDRWGHPPELPELEGRPLRDFLDAAFDYCDEAALQVDALPWTEPRLIPSTPPEAVERVRGAWRAFVTAGPPAPRALGVFLDAVWPGDHGPGR